MTKEERERLAAARHLRAERRRTIAHLVDLLGHDEYDVATSAAESLVIDAGDQAEPRLLAVLRNPGCSVQARALAGEMLSRTHSSKGVGAALRIARDPREDLDLRRLLAESVGYSRDEKALKPLVSLTLKADGDLTLRSVAVQSMGDLGPMALDFLQKLALDPTADPELRVATVLVLGGSGAERVRPTLNELARRRDAPPRQLHAVHSHPWRLRHAAAAAREQLNRDRPKGADAQMPLTAWFAFATPSFCRIRPGTDSLTPPGRVRGPNSSCIPRRAWAPDRTPRRSPHTTTGSSSKQDGGSRLDEYLPTWPGVSGHSPPCRFPRPR